MGLEPGKVVLDDAAVEVDFGVVVGTGPIIFAGHG